MFPDNQGKVCDAVLRYLEEQTGEARFAIEHPERHGGPGAVDLIFRLGQTQYALEHTRLEPYEDKMRQDALFFQLIEPVMELLCRDMPKPGTYTLFFPIDIRIGASGQELEALRDSLVLWIRKSASILHANNPARLGRDEEPHGICEELKGRPDGFPFDLILERDVHWAESGDHDGTLFPARLISDPIEPMRRKRIETAIDRKRPKLAYRKQKGTSSILVLENNDISLTNHALVGEHLAVLLHNKPDWLDMLMFIYTTVSTWSLYSWSWNNNWWSDEGSTSFNATALQDIC